MQIMVPLTLLSDIKESQNISSLHKQIKNCDGILAVSTVAVKQTSKRKIDKT